MVLNEKVNPKGCELYKGLTLMLCVLIVVVVVVVVVVVFGWCLFFSQENDITGVLDETFSVTRDRFGEHVIVELSLGGATEDVTEENQEEYVDLVVADQFCAFMKGLGGVVVLDLLRVFDEHEPELL